MWRVREKEGSIRALEMHVVDRQAATETLTAGAPKPLNGLDTLLSGD